MEVKIIATLIIVVLLCRLGCKYVEEECDGFAEDNKAWITFGCIGVMSLIGIFGISLWWIWTL